jgi:hypothetical protein
VPAVDSTGALRDVSLEVWAAHTELPYFEKVGFLSTCPPKKDSTFFLT